VSDGLWYTESEDASCGLLLLASNEMMNLIYCEDPWFCLFQLT
jgi:hypothetical protein